MAFESLNMLFFTLFSLTLVLNASATTKYEPEDGGWKPIKDTKDPEAIQIAKFAVSEYNLIGNFTHKLIFMKIEKGEYQVVTGIKYRLTIETRSAMRTRDSEEYEAVVWDKPSEYITKLISFNRVQKSV